MSRVKNKGFVEILIVIILFASAIVGFIVLTSNNVKKSANEDQVPVKEPTTIQDNEISENVLPTKYISPSPADTSSWEVYDNETRAFSFRHPSDWTMWGENWFLGVFPEDHHSEGMSMYFMEDINDLSGYIDEAYKNLDENNIQNVTINDLQGYALLQPNSTQKYVLLLEKNSNVVRIGINNNLDDEDEEIVRQIISTIHYVGE